MPTRDALPRPTGLIAAAAVVVALVGFATGPAASAEGRAVPRYAKPAPVMSTDAASSGGIATEDSADLDNDGYADVFTTGHRARTLDTFEPRVILNDRHGGFVDSTSTIFDGPPPRLQWPRKVVIADFNNDGRPDIFVADHGYDGEPGPGFHNTLVLSTPAGKLRDATGNLPPRIRTTVRSTSTSAPSTRPRARSRPS